MPGVQCPRVITVHDKTSAKHRYRHTYIHWTTTDRKSPRQRLAKDQDKITAVDICFSFYRRRIGDHQCHRMQRIKNRSPTRVHKYTYEQTHMQGLSLHAWLCTEDDLTAWTVIDVSRPQSKICQRPLMTNAKTCIQTRPQQ